MNIIMQLAKQSVEEYYYAEYEGLEALAMEGEEPTPEMEQAARSAACIDQDNAALCIDQGPDTTDCGQAIPYWAF